MNEIKRPLGITDVVLRDAHQSLFATRLRLDDMLPIAEKLDKVGYWSLETWGGATFDACIRYLGEDPWERIRALKEAMPNTPQAMLLRGQNLLGYRHYADDVVDKFVERAKTNGVDVFRVFDAMNDPRNLERAIKAVRQVGGHAQGTISYTVSPVHTWIAGRSCQNHCCNGRRFSGYQGYGWATHAVYRLRFGLTAEKRALHSSAFALPCDDWLIHVDHPESGRSGD